MFYMLTEEQLMIRDLARQIAVETIVPVRAELDEQNKFPWDVMKAMAQADLFGLFIPEEYGGLGKKGFELCIAVEELSKACLGVSTSFAANALGTYPILLYGSDEQKKKYLPDIAAGKRLVAFGLTEANAGSDASGVQTTAKLEGNEYVLNGTKQWITNGGEAEIYTVIAITDKSKGPAAPPPLSWKRARRASPSARRKIRWVFVRHPRRSLSSTTAAFPRKT